MGNPSGTARWLARVTQGLNISKNLTGGASVHRVIPFTGCLDGVFHWDHCEGVVLIFVNWQEVCVERH